MTRTPTEITEALTALEASKEGKDSDTKLKINVMIDVIERDRSEQYILDNFGDGDNPDAYGEAGLLALDWLNGNLKLEDIL